MNGRQRPGPNSALCPRCGRLVGLLVDGTLAVHSPAGDAYDTCPARRPDNTMLKAAIRSTLGAFILVVTLGLAVFADHDTYRLDVQYGTTPTRTTTELGVGE